MSKDIYQRLLDGKVAAAPAMRWWPRQASALFEYSVAVMSGASFIARRSSGRLYALGNHWGRLLPRRFMEVGSKSQVAYVGGCIAFMNAGKEGSLSRLTELESELEDSIRHQTRILRTAIEDFPAATYDELLTRQVSSLASCMASHMGKDRIEKKDAERKLRSNALSLGALCAEWLRVSDEGNP